MPTNDGFSGVSNCYVFKSRLQEYAQKNGLSTPVYETLKEGPSHEPSFRSTVIVKDIRYDSLPGFFNRKAAEQSAAEVALMELSKCDELSDCISQPVHETGLCKNLLQEYAQKMNYAIPVYLCQKIETPGRGTLFKCTVDIGGIQYIGASAKTKKEAEIKAARTALLAIQSSASDSSQKANGNCQLTVIPSRKRAAESAPVLEEAVSIPKAKKSRFKKKMLKKRLAGGKVEHNQGDGTGNPNVIPSEKPGSEIVQTEASVAQGAGHQPSSMHAVRNSQNGVLVPESSGGEAMDVEGALTCQIPGDYDQSQHRMPPEVPVESNGGVAKMLKVPGESTGDATEMLEVVLGEANGDAVKMAEVSGKSNGDATTMSESEVVLGESNGDTAKMSEVSNESNGDATKTSEVVGDSNEDAVKLSEASVEPKGDVLEAMLAQNGASTVMERESIEEGGGQL